MKPALPNTSSPSIERLDSRELQSFLADPANPVLVSFPRTGSHWLRVLMELQFQRPSLVRVFFYFDSRDYLCWHTHDDQLDLHRERVIYLHRDPIDTIYSQLRYTGTDPTDRTAVFACGDRYLAHLRKWLHQDAFTREKLVLGYHQLQIDPALVLEQVARFLNAPWDAERCRCVLPLATKELISRKTREDDARVIDQSPEYTGGRPAFRRQFTSAIRQRFLAVDPRLASVFDTTPSL